MCFFRAAVLSVRNPKDAEAAVREMNGRSIQGHTLHVEHILKSPTDSQATIKEPCVHLAPAALKAGSVGKRSITHSSNNNVHTSRVSIIQQTLSKMRENKALCYHNALISVFSLNYLSPLERLTLFLFHFNYF